jgi:hypothetical protein
MHENPITAFARDFSRNDETLVDEVRTWLAKPPIDEKAIGFYGSEEYAPRTRVFLATVSLLDKRHLIDSVEDKYTVELFWRWCDKGVIDVAALPPAARAVFGPLVRDKAGITMASMDDYIKACWASYAKATEELEQQITTRGKVLLSIDATEGDTMFFALVEPHIAARWKDKALSDEDGYYAGVRLPMWDRFWDHLTYFSKLVNEPDFRGYPPGTRRREIRLPFAE